MFRPVVQPIASGAGHRRHSKTHADEGRCRQRPPSRSITKQSWPLLVLLTHPLFRSCVLLACTYASLRDLFRTQQDCSLEAREQHRNRCFVRFSRPCGHNGSFAVGTANHAPCTFELHERLAVHLCLGTLRGPQSNACGTDYDRPQRPPLSSTFTNRGPTYMLGPRVLKINYDTSRTVQ
eukprot:1152070-Pelagomonas_calceolata.AAC.2